MATIEIASAKRRDLTQVEQFYAQCSYAGGVHISNTILVARHKAHIVGAVRLCAEQDVTVLRGMQVALDFQRIGVGSLLLRRALPYLDVKTSFCLPYVHLEDFYRSAGFILDDTNKTPYFLRERLASYLAKGQHVIVMHRPIN